MFHGSIPASLRSIISEHVRDWRTDDVFVGCSGNFTVERVVNAARPDVKLHGNDVTLYSCILGSYFAGAPVPVTINPDCQWSWLDPYAATPEGVVACVMLSTRMMMGAHRTNAYYERMRQAYRDQWPVMFDQTLERVRKNDGLLASFRIGDVVEEIDAVGDMPVICFPPFFGGDYEKMFEALEDAFIWPAPTYAEMDADRRELLFDKVRDREYWLFGTHVRHPELDEKYLRGIVQTTNRGVPVYVYANSGAKRVVQPRQDIEPLLIDRLGQDEKIGDEASLIKLTGGQFSGVRSQYMNAHIKPGTPTAAYGVLVDGKLVGVFALSTVSSLVNWDTHLPGPHCYLLSDFPVAPSRYGRLAKLIVMMAITKDVRLLMERTAGHRIRGITTTAYSNHPVSMKYRGVLELLIRKDAPKEHRNKYQLEYGAPFSDMTLNEALSLWKRKHGK